MTQVRWTPFNEIAAMQNLIDRAFYDTRRPVTRTAAQPAARTLALDAFETADGYTFYANLPGVSAESIQVKFENDILSIEAELPAHTVQAEGTKTLLQERTAGRFSRQLHLPQPVDFDNATATYENGVLTLTLPKTPEAQPRVLTVKHGSSNGASQS